MKGLSRLSGVFEQEPQQLCWVQRLRSAPRGEGRRKKGEEGRAGEEEEEWEEAAVPAM